MCFMHFVVTPVVKASRYRQEHDWSTKTFIQGVSTGTKHDTLKLFVYGFICGSVQNVCVQTLMYFYVKFDHDVS